MLSRFYNRNIVVGIHTGLLTKGSSCYQHNQFRFQSNDSSNKNDQTKKQNNTTWIELLAKSLTSIVVGFSIGTSLYLHYNNPTNSYHYKYIAIVEKSTAKVAEWIPRGYDFMINYKSLSGNPFVKPEFVIDHHACSWDWNRIARNRAIISADLIAKLYYKPWDYKYLSSSKDFDPLELTTKMPYVPWYWHSPGFSSNPNTSIEFLEKHGKAYWDMRYLHARYEDTYYSFLPDHVSDGTEYYYDGFNYGQNGLSSNENITCEYIKANLDKGWYWPALLEHAQLTSVEFIETHVLESKYLSETYHMNTTDIFEKLSRNKHLPKEFIMKYKDQLNYDSLAKSGNPNVTAELIIELHEHPWPWNCMHYEPYVDENLVRNTHFKDWNWKELSSCTWLTKNFIDDYGYNNLDWDLLSENRCINDKIVRSHHFIKWDLEKLSNNPSISLGYVIEISCGAYSPLRFIVKRIVNQYFIWPLFGN